jgi:nucleotide-binding universal stress UspA family protein
MPASEHQCIIVGVVRGQSDALLKQAVVFADRFGSLIVCAQVNPTRYTVTENADGTVTSLPLNPELAELRDEVFDPAMRDYLDSVLTPTGVPWTTRALAGNPARALARLADTLDAEMIIVGTRQPTLRGTVREFLAGSVAVYLAHHQNRPVVVIPQDPQPAESPLPWEDSR